MTAFKLVWFSTDEHLNTFGRILEQGMRQRGFWGPRYQIPEGFPFVAGRMLPFPACPVIFQNSGRLDISPASLRFESRYWHPPLWMAFNLGDMNFNIERRDILNIGLDVFRPAPGWPVHLSFVRLQTKREAPLDNFLLCVGTVFLPAWSRRRTNLLYAALHRLIVDDENIERK